MIQRNVQPASQLRKLIRKIVREELNEFIAEKKNEKESASLPALAQEQRKDDPTLKPPRMAEDPHTGTWAIFGTPELDPVQTRSEHPRALPGFPELYRPDFTGFDAPPFIPKQPREKAEKISAEAHSEETKL